MTLSSALDIPISRLRRLAGRVPVRHRRWLGATAGVALGVAALVFAARGVDREGLASAFGQVGWWWIAAAAVANGGTIVAQGLAWRIGLEAGGMGPVRARHAIAATWIGKAGNQLLPGKVGEIARVAIIRGHVDPEHREVSRIVGSVVAQRAFNILATFIVVALSAAVLPLPVAIPGGRWAPALTLVVVAVGVVLARRLRSRGPSGRGGVVRAAAGRFASGAALLRPDRRAAVALALHLGGLACQIAMMEFLLRGFAVAAPPTAPLLIIALVGIAGAVPGAPGGAGLNQAALVAPLGAAYGVAPETALAFALGLQATLGAVAVAGGLVALAHHRRARPLRAAFP